MLDTTNPLAKSARPQAPLPMQMLGSKFMTIRVNEQFNRVDVYLRGAFDNPQSNTNELAELMELSNQYSTVLFHINSEGGRTDTLRELYSIADMFDTVITVAASQVASAGAMLWSRGDVRVVQKYTTLMFHRESYVYGGKTKEHVDLSNHIDVLYDRLAEEQLAVVLTQEELETIKYTEIWRSDVDMIERGVAISWDEFNSRSMEPIEHHNLYIINKKPFMMVGENRMVPVGISIESETPLSLFDIIYHRDGLEDDDQSVSSQSEQPESIEDEDVNALEFLTENIHKIGFNAFSAGMGEKALRTELKKIFGVGEFVVRRNGDIEVISNGESKYAGNYKTGKMGTKPSE